MRSCTPLQPRNRRDKCPSSLLQPSTVLRRAYVTMADSHHSNMHIYDDHKRLSDAVALKAQPLGSPAPALNTPPAALAKPRCTDGQPAGPAAVGIIYCAVTELHELAGEAVWKLLQLQTTQRPAQLFLLSFPCVPLRSLQTMQSARHGPSPLKLNCSKRAYWRSACSLCRERCAAAEVKGMAAVHALHALYSACSILCMLLGLHATWPA